MNMGDELGIALDPLHKMRPTDQPTGRALQLRCYLSRLLSVPPSPSLRPHGGPAHAPLLRHPRQGRAHSLSRSLTRQHNERARGADAAATDAVIKILLYENDDDDEEHGARGQPPPRRRYCFSLKTRPSLPPSLARSHVARPLQVASSALDIWPTSRLSR